MLPHLLIAYPILAPHWMAGMLMEHFHLQQELPGKHHLSLATQDIGQWQVPLLVWPTALGRA